MNRRDSDSDLPHYVSAAPFDPQSVERDAGQGAAAIASVMLIISFLMLFAINLIQAWSRRRYGYGN